MLRLAASGIYAIMSFTVAERTRGLGIRTALEIQRISIAMDAVRRALLQLTVGVPIGTPIAWGLFVGLGTESFEGSPVLAALVSGISIMILVGLLTCTVPTQRIMPT